METKKSLRQRILAQLRAQTENDRVLKSEDIARQVALLPVFKESSVILLYSSFDGEVLTQSLFERILVVGKTLVLPVVDSKVKKMSVKIVCDLKKDLIPGAFGIYEPRGDLPELTVDKIHCAIVPGVAFDRRGFRLGRGHGYYDRFLAGLPKPIPTVGLAFDFQLIDCLPEKASHDVPVSMVVSNAA